MIFLSLLISTAFATDSWFCTTQASKIQNASVVSCGIGIGQDEATARAKALANAKEEFDFICHASDGCLDRNVSVSPGRTSCEGNHGLVKCYRMVTFTIGEKNKAKAIARIQPKRVVDEAGYPLGDLRYGMAAGERLLREMREGR